MCGSGCIISPPAAGCEGYSELYGVYVDLVKRAISGEGVGVVPVGLCGACVHKGRVPLQLCCEAGVGSVDGLGEGVDPSCGEVQSGAETSRLSYVRTGEVEGDGFTRPGGDVHKNTPSSDASGAGGSGSAVLGLGSNCFQLPRGPNYLRNQASRMRTKVRKEEKRIMEAEARGRRAAERDLRASGTVGADGCSVVGSRAKQSRTVDEQRLHDLKVKRQIIQEERKLKKLESPAQMIEDAMKQVALAEKYAKMANDSKVAAWAAELSSFSAESIAKSSGFKGNVETVCTSVTGLDERVGGQVKVESGREVKGEKKTLGLASGWQNGARAAASGVVAGRPAVVGLRGATLDDQTKIASGMASVSGVSYRSDGVPYNKYTAADWVRRYDFLRKHIEVGKPEPVIAKDARVSVGEVQKFFRLRKEFGLK